MSSTVNQNSFTLTWRKMNVVSKESDLKWKKSHVNVVSNEQVSNDCALK